MRLLGLVMLAVVTLAPPLRADDPPMFITLPAGALANGVGANGAVVVGSLRSGGGFYWMPTSGTVFIGGDFASEVSRDGKTIVGTGIDPNKRKQAGIWVRASEWRLLGSIVPSAAPCDDLLSDGIGASADGKVIVGLAWNGCSIARAFRWEESTGVVDLGSTVPNRSSRADAVSGNGRVAVGWQELTTGFWQGARWIDGKQTVFTGPDGPVGQAFGTNVDGAIIVGQVCNPNNPLEESAWMWTTAGGVQCLPPPRTKLPAFYLGKAVATSDDGRVIGGGQSFGLESEAVIWIDKTPYYLKDYLQQHGVADAFSGWVNTGTITDISRDGRVLVGYGAGPKDFTGYIVILPPLGGQP
jgi:probable HAF family extracellular repeat protein